MLNQTVLQQFQDCQDIINQVQISNNDDSWQWSKDPSGIFTVASMRKFFQTTSHSKFFCLSVKQLGADQNKYLQLAAERTSSALSIRAIHIPSSLCPLCGDYEENTRHLLISYSIANMVWTYIATWCTIQPMFAFSVKDFLELHKTMNVLVNT